MRYPSRAKDAQRRILVRQIPPNHRTADNLRQAKGSIMKVVTDILTALIVVVMLLGCAALVKFLVCYLVGI